MLPSLQPALANEHDRVLRTDASRARLAQLAACCKASVRRTMHERLALFRRQCSA